MTLLRQENVQILQAEIGQIGKVDIVSAQTNVEINPLDAVILGFNVEVEKDLDTKGIKIFTNPVVYRLIEDLQLWRKNKQAEIERERLMGMATIGKIEILPQYVFRNSNPAIFGARVVAGRIKSGMPMIDESGEEIARVKSLQHEKANVEEAKEGQELAVALSGIAFDRKLKDKKYLYIDVSDKQFKHFKKNKEYLSAEELRVLQEIADMKRKKDINWGL
ncbi:MAG: translation initiation factor IF-2, partial [archaeon]